MYMWNLYSFINHVTPNKFNLKNKKKSMIEISDNSEIFFLGGREIKESKSYHKGFSLFYQHFEEMTNDA